MQTTTRRRLPDIEQRICDIMSDSHGIPRHKVSPSDRVIEDLYCDSLDFLDFLFRLEKEFLVTLDPPRRSTNSIYKVIFTRRPLRLTDIAELVYLQQGTGRPERKGQFKQVSPSPSISPSSTTAVPFTQLDGTWKQLSANGSPLFETLDPENSIAAYRRRSDGMRCLLLPSADVELGSNTPESLPDEQPLHRAQLDSFVIDAEPVSTTAYCRFLNSVHATDEHLHDWFLLTPDDHRQQHVQIHQSQLQWEPLPGVEQLPMILVSWFGANAYSLWANGANWNTYRTEDGFLPSEAQWEYAARGPSSTKFPWGNDPESPHTMRCGLHRPGLAYHADTLPMSAVNESLGMSPFGLHHMAGNVWQWCGDWYDEHFYRNPAASGQNPLNRMETGIRSERGGSWVGPAHLCRSSFRRGRAPYAKGRCLGFRCISSTTSLPH